MRMRSRSTTTTTTTTTATIIHNRTAAGRLAGVMFYDGCVDVDILDGYTLRGTGFFVTRQATYINV